jgi:hypothetical protein
VRWGGEDEVKVFQFLRLILSGICCLLKPN